MHDGHPKCTNSEVLTPKDKEGNVFIRYLIKLAKVGRCSKHEGRKVVALLFALGWGVPE